jgi:hypothetical protein
MRVDLCDAISIRQGLPAVTFTSRRASVHAAQLGIIQNLAAAEKPKQ